MNSHEEVLGGFNHNIRSGSRKTVFMSYRYRDSQHFREVREIAARLRFFSIEVILDQRSLDYGEDIREFMRQSVRRADAMIVLLTNDYNQALLAQSGPGAGVRFEVQVAQREKAARPAFQVIPLLLEDIRPVAPFDQMKCATLQDIDQIITQLGLSGGLEEGRILGGRYRVDRLIEQRGITSVFLGLDTLADQLVEIYLVPAIQDNLKDRLQQFERVVKGRSMAFSPFLLNYKDTHIDGRGGFYLITERFDGIDLGACLHRSQLTHPLGALVIAYQVCLALCELHSVGISHGGLAPRCIRLDPRQTTCKIVDFEFATSEAFAKPSAVELSAQVTIWKAKDRGTPYRLQSKATVWYLSTGTAGRITQGSNRYLGSGVAATFSSAKRLPIWNGPKVDWTVRSCSASQRWWKYMFNSSRSLTRGTGVANLRCTALTVPSAWGFSLPRAGMQKRGSKT